MVNLNRIQTCLQKEGDYTIRLLNRNASGTKRYTFALLWFNGGTGLWVVRLLEQNMTAVFEESNKGFLRAKQILIERIGEYLSQRYQITTLNTGYYIPPWLRRKR